MKKVIALAAALAAGVGISAGVALSDSDPPRLCDGGQVTYTQDGQTVVGDCGLDRNASLWVAGPDNIVRKIPRSAVVTTPTNTGTTPTTPTTPTDPNPPADSSRPFSDDSPFNTPVGNNPTVLSNSATIVANSGIAGKPSPISTDRAESNNYDHPCYTTSSSDPLATLRFQNSASRAIDGIKIPVPNYAIPAGYGSTNGDLDRHICFIAPDGWEYNLWKTTKSGSPGNYVFTSQIGGRLPANGQGIKTQALVNQYPNQIDGGVEAKFSERAGLITAAEMAAGKINHALFVVDRGSDGNFVYPGFNSTNGSTPVNANGTRPHMGTRYWLDMTPAQIDATRAPAWEKIIAKAANEYGIYVGDKGGNGFSFMLESSTPYRAAGVTNPWAAYWATQGVRKDATWGYNAAFSGQIDWEGKLKVLAPPAP